MNLSTYLGKSILDGVNNKRRGPDGEINLVDVRKSKKATVARAG